MTTTLQGKVATIFLFTMPLVAQAVKAGTSARAGFDSRDLRAFLEILSLVALFRLRSDAHHLRFAQQRALGRYVIGEFAADRAGCTACFARSPNAMIYVVGAGVALFFSLNRLRFANPPRRSISRTARF